MEPPDFKFIFYTRVKSSWENDILMLREMLSYLSHTLSISPHHMIMTWASDIDTTYYYTVYPNYWGRVNSVRGKLVKVILNVLWNKTSATKRSKKHWSIGNIHNTIHWKYWHYSLTNMYLYIISFITLQASQSMH